MKKENILNNLKSSSLDEILSLNPHDKYSLEREWWIEDVHFYVSNEKWDSLRTYLTDTDFSN